MEESESGRNMVAFVIGVACITVLIWSWGNRWQRGQRREELIIGGLLVASLVAINFAMLLDRWIAAFVIAAIVIVGIAIISARKRM